MSASNADKLRAIEETALAEVEHKRRVGIQTSFEEERKKMVRLMERNDAQEREARRGK